MAGQSSTSWQAAAQTEVHVIAQDNVRGTVEGKQFDLQAILWNLSGKLTREEWLELAGDAWDAVH